MFRSDQGANVALQLLDYWRWVESCLTDNTTRGLLSEFLVAAAIGQYREYPGSAEEQHAKEWEEELKGQREWEELQKEWAEEK